MAGRLRTPVYMEIMTLYAQILICKTNKNILEKLIFKKIIHVCVISPINYEIII